MIAMKKAEIEAIEKEARERWDTTILPKLKETADFKRFVERKEGMEVVGEVILGNLFNLYLLGYLDGRRKEKA